MSQERPGTFSLFRSRKAQTLAGIGLAVAAVVTARDTIGRSDSPANPNSSQSQTIALDIRNCLTSAPFPTKPDSTSQACRDLAAQIDGLSRKGNIADCVNISTVLDNKPSDYEVQRLRDCASASSVSLASTSK